MITVVFLSRRDTNIYDSNYIVEPCVESQSLQTEKTVFHYNLKAYSVVVTLFHVDTNIHGQYNIHLPTESRTSDHEDCMPLTLKGPFHVASRLGLFIQQFASLQLAYVTL